MSENPKLTPRTKDQVLGCMVGGAVGDALGYAVEFASYDSIVMKYGKKGITRFKLDRHGVAEISDDTQMSLFTAAGILLGMTRGFMRGVMGRIIDTYSAGRIWIGSIRRNGHPGTRMPAWILGSWMCRSCIPVEHLVIPVWRLCILWKPGKRLATIAAAAVV